MNKIIPVEDRLLIEIEDETKEIGLVLPEGVKREQHRIGKVLDVGPEVTLSVDNSYGKLGNKLLIGKRVLFERYGPLSLSQFNKNWFLVRQQYILAILKD